METGRKTIYTEELGEELCARIAEGNSLRTVCLADDMPCIRSVMYWKRLYPEFLHQYEAACIERSEMLVEDMLYIADSSDPNHAAKTRIQVDTRKWAASKMKPKKYGESAEPEKQVVPFIVNTVADESD